MLQTTPKETQPIHWAGKVRRDHIRRMYEQDARGIRDEELIEEVGCGLYARCVSILEVTAAVKGEVKCHGCGAIIRHGSYKEETVRCDACGWGVPWRTYQKSYQGKQLHGGAAIGIFAGFVKQFPVARDARERLLLIDRLIHEFHYNVSRTDPIPHPNRPTAANLIEGDKMRDVIAFLDELSEQRDLPKL